MAADLTVPPATLSRWGMPNEWHLSFQIKLPWLHLADGWKRMQSLYIFIEILKCQQNKNQAPTTNAFVIQLFHLCFLWKREHTYARPVIIQLGAGTETPGSPVGLPCCQWVTVESLNCILLRELKNFENIVFLFSRWLWLMSLPCRALIVLKHQKILV